jgi:hypothetical protein
MTENTAIDLTDLSIIDAEDLEKIQGKKQRADWVKQVIRENGLDKDKEFMDEIDPLIEELLKE